jgi:uncharacterized protein YbjT (DUF2867 family)
MMKIVVVGGTGLIGSALVDRLRELGHQVVPASRSTGVDIATGTGLAEALRGADIVIDASNARSDDPVEMLNFFRHAGRVLLDAAKRAGVKHHVTLSMLGADRLSLSGFFLAKLTQENLVRTSGLPYTILRSAPFFETIYGIANDADGVPIPVRTCASRRFPCSRLRPVMLPWPWRMPRSLLLPTPSLRLPDQKHFH